MLRRRAIALNMNMRGLETWSNLDHHVRRRTRPVEVVIPVTEPPSSTYPLTS